MEIGIDEHIPTYSGGLGVLAGDTLKSCADLNVPIVGVTLLSEKGYFYQELDMDGNQIELP
ncbi:MAG: glycogen/starch/alpha-glucan phosphorylase, partial [Euryarchaeota archaeon]|nr:glycogen/starch/alpha-glucan phosphorylase [Euryarchaeota archaeon]